jgi:predicted pyridoxine 5'-phosphate oxidase superfamily flavin-nucleotide-binding protein
MAERFKVLKEKHIEFIKKQSIFFVGTAGAEGTVNVSPKGMDTLRVINERKVVWLNLTGSGLFICKAALNPSFIWQG